MKRRAAPAKRPPSKRPRAQCHDPPIWDVACEACVMRLHDRSPLDKTTTDRFTATMLEAVLRRNLYTRGPHSHALLDHLLGRMERGTVPTRILEHAAHCLGCMQRLVDHGTVLETPDHSLVGRCFDQNCCPEVRDYLLDRIDVTYTHLGRPVLLMAVAWGFSKQHLCTILDKGADPNGNDPRNTPLADAMWSLKVDESRLLLEAGATLRPDQFIQLCKPRCGSTRRQAQDEAKTCQLIKLCLKHGADVDAKDRWGNTALMHVVQSPAWLEATNILIDAGANSKQKNANGKTAFDRATKAAKRILARAVKE